MKFRIQPRLFGTVIKIKKKKKIDICPFDSNDRSILKYFENKIKKEKSFQQIGTNAKENEYLKPTRPMFSEKSSENFVRMQQ